MKNIFTLALLFAVLFSYAEDNKITNSEIKEVKIYTTGAVVTRTVKTTVEAGTTSLEFDNLSSSIDKQSVSVTGTGDVTILSVQYNLNYLNKEKVPVEIQILKDSLDYFNHEIDKLNDLTEVYTEEETLILNNKSIRNAREGVTAENLTEMADFYRKRLSDIKAKLLDISDKTEKFNAEKDRINSQLSLLNVEEWKPTGSVIVTLSSNKKTQVYLNISYLIYEAGWTPLYDVRAKDISSPIQLNYKANVYQKSGEDWKNVHIILSTGNPTISGVMPNLYSWHLNLIQMDYDRKGGQKMAFGWAKKEDEGELQLRGAKAADTKVTMDGQKPKVVNSAAETVAGVYQSVSVSQNQLSVDFDISIPYSVPSDGKIYTVDVRQFNMKSDYSYHAIPKLDHDAFLIAHITGWDTLNLLSGNANIFFENSFIGSSYLQLQNTKDTLEISLGRDKRIVINREKQKDYSSSQMIGSNQFKTLSYEISVRNTKAESITITIEDQIPVSDNKDFTVKMIEYSKADYNEKTGIITWKLNVNPSETQKKKLTYSVKYPKDQEIPNL